MSAARRTLPFSLVDLAWRTAFRLGFRVARVWWRVRRPRHEGALVVIHVGAAVLLVRSSYRRAWNFPGGGVRRGEAPEAAARRELAEEIGLTSVPLEPAGFAGGVWDGRRDGVHFFELRLDRLPELALDERADGRGTIRFQPQQPMWNNRNWSSWTPALDPTPQFLSITDARTVFDRIQRASQTG